MNGSSFRLEEKDKVGVLMKSCQGLSVPSWRMNWTQYHEAGEQRLPGITLVVAGSFLLATTERVWSTQKSRVGEGGGG